MTIIRTKAQEAVMRVFQGTLQRIHADRLVRQSCWRDGQSLYIAGQEYGLESYHRVVVLGAGKASSAMASAIEDLLPDKRMAGLVVTKHGHSLPLARIEQMEAAHPVPDESSARAGEQMLEMARSCEAEDLVIVLLSGGASSLIEVPAEGITLRDIQLVTASLLKSGADIRELNTVRACLSQIKAGGLARAASAGMMVCLLLSDVIGNDRALVGSGPCWGAPPPSEAASEVLTRYKAPVQESVAQRLASMPTLDPVKPPHAVIGDIYTVLEAAQKAAQEMGLRPKVFGKTFDGEARVVGAGMAAEALALQAGGKYDCVIAAGETTVSVKGSGLGGRSQELACAAALAMEGATDVALLAAGTDGTDGPTDAAGGLVDGETYKRCNLRQALDDNDCYHALEAADALVITGQTQTNLNDLVVVARVAEE